MMNIIFNQLLNERLWVGSSRVPRALGASKRCVQSKLGKEGSSDLLTTTRGFP